MDKKTKIIVAIIVAAVVIGGAYYGYHRWQQQRLAAQLMKLYGGNPGLLGGLTGGGNAGDVADQIAKQLPPDLVKKMAEEAAKEEVKQQEEDAKEATKTPQDKFNETKTITTTGTLTPVVKEEIEPKIIAVFGGAKPTLYGEGYMGETSFTAAFKVPKDINDEDFNKLVKEFTSKGYKIGMNTVDATSGTAILEKDGTTVSLNYDNSESQQIGVMYTGGTPSEE
ncbi:MAG: hypothetical protein PHQ46_12905 [Negativicutes bacterium]|nr:hypothetical protein [Negativicutes bacterium]